MVGTGASRRLTFRLHLGVLVLGLAAREVPASEAGAPPAADFVVAPGGSDDGPGTAARPFATLERARDAVRRLLAASSEGAGKDVTVLLRGGVYRIRGPVVFGPEDAARGEATVTYAAWPGESPVLSGGRPIGGWRRVSGGAFETTVDDVAAGKWRFRELFVGGERRPRARRPNDGTFRIEQAGPDNRTSFTFREGDLRAYEDLPAVELVFLHDWSISRVGIESIDEGSRVVELAAPVGPASRHFAMTWFEPHPRYFLENSSAFLDRPGEWQLDPRSGVLRYLPLPGEEPESLDAVAPVAEEILAVRGRPGRPVRNLRFAGISIEHCAWAIPEGGYAAGQAGFHERRVPGEGGALREPLPSAVTFEIAEGCRFEDGRIAHTGASGIWLGSRTRGCAITRTAITDISGNGVLIGEDRSRDTNGRPWWQAAPEEAASGNRVESSLIERCGRQFFGSVGIWVGMAEGTRIVRNEIRHQPYTGVSLGWMWNPQPTPCRKNLVERNHIHHVMQVLSDGGGIYTLGRQPGTVLRENLIHDVPRNSGRAESNGMFLDEGTTSILIEKNTIYDVERSPLRFHRAGENTVRQNVLVVTPGVPPIRYNNTREEDIEKIENLTPETLSEDLLAVARRSAGPEAGTRENLESRSTPGPESSRAASR